MNRVFEKLAGDSQAGAYADFWKQYDEANGEDRKKLEITAHAVGEPFWEGCLEWRKESPLPPSWKTVRTALTA
jgi:hypothetical protein